MLILAASDGGRITVEQLVGSQDMPRKFLEAIIGELRRSGLVTSGRGVDGGYALARPSGEISVADVLRSVDGPLAEVRGVRPQNTAYHGTAAHLGSVWVAARPGLRAVLENVSLDEMVTGRLPPR